MCCGNVGYVSVAKMGVCVVEMGGGMCCGNGGYVSVAEMGVCVVEMWGMYQLQMVVEADVFSCRCTHGAQRSAVMYVL